MVGGASGGPSGEGLAPGGGGAAPLVPDHVAASGVAENAGRGRWVAAGYVQPTRKTIGGQYRWDLDDLEEQLRAAEAKGDEGPPFAAEFADRPKHPEEPN
ncbi:hypothetical protein PHK61_31105 [Actinomycetospora lutea]|uniref:hypothetical protein n=1 Tax=Actinomycetospora lutea TaxID=663604 RepID=UPI002365C7BA|nr:hypothetical protein [Actinomycetospora lutea]MDD7942870.1 hypothetical protein [Actinomycetospora lutea]